MGLASQPMYLFNQISLPFSNPSLSLSLRIFCRFEVNLSDVCGPHGITQFLNMCMCACVCVCESNQATVGLPDTKQSVSVSLNLQPVNQNVQYFCSERCAPSSQRPPISRHIEDLLLCAKYDEVRAPELAPLLLLLLLHKTLT